MRKIIWLWILFAGIPIRAMAAGLSHSQPNVLWIVVEDMSEHWGCYGERTIQTPNIDRLARQGMLFERAFVTGPICSPSRSALISGMYQTTLGAHNHRSQTDEKKGRTTPEYEPSYRVPTSVKLLPELFREAGYYTVLDGSYYLEGKEVSHIPHKKGLGKSDYNFLWENSLYDSGSWEGRKSGQPFFAQIQLNGGKKREVEVDHPVDPATVKLPPYYPGDNPVFRKDWAEYLNSVLFTDLQVGQILDRLEKEGLAENTAVFLFTDHGISHIRGKQFLYEEGIKVPLIVRWPGQVQPASRNRNLTSHIDIAAASLGVAGITLPETMQGVDFFAKDHTPRKEIFCARDRADETVDVIRGVRTDRFKYIRNYYNYRGHAQPNQYKDAKEIMVEMRRLHQQGSLSPLQDGLFAPERPAEELYDLSQDPYELHNLAESPKYRKVLADLREKNLAYENSTLDMGLIPEPILEDLGLKYGNKFFIMKQEGYPETISRIRKVIACTGKGTQDEEGLLKAMRDESPAVRYWAATGLGVLQSDSPKTLQALDEGLADQVGSVRIASALAMCRKGQEGKALEKLLEAMASTNALERLYAILAMEESRSKSPLALQTAKVARNDPYEFVRRVGERLCIQVKD